jgi:hypothetical protein
MRLEKKVIKGKLAKEQIASDMKEALGKTEISDVLTSLKQLVAHGSPVETVGIEVQNEFKNILVLSPSLRIADNQGFLGDASAGVQSLQGKILRLEKLISHAEVSWDRYNADQEEYAAELGSGLRSEKVFDAEISDFDAPGVLHSMNRDYNGSATGPEVDSQSFSTTYSEANTTSKSSLDLDVDTVEEFQSVDPEILKQLVSKILLEELSGSLGEKITSNIRALIRAEVGAVIKTYAKE